MTYTPIPPINGEYAVFTLVISSVEPVASFPDAVSSLATEVVSVDDFSPHAVVVITTAVTIMSAIIFLIRSFILFSSLN